MKVSIRRYWLPATVLAVLAVAVAGEGVALAKLDRVERAARAQRADGWPPPLVPWAHSGRTTTSALPAPWAPRWMKSFWSKGADPFAEVNRMDQQMQSQMRSLWSAPEATGGAQVRLAEKPKSYVLRVEVPHLAQAKVHVNAHAHEVSLQIQRRSATSRSRSGQHFQSRESQSSVESFALAHAVDPSQMKMKRQGDTLTVTLPKRQVSRSAFEDQARPSVGAGAGSV